MRNEKTNYQLKQEKAEVAEKETNKKIEELNSKSFALYSKLTSIQNLFDTIRNIPNDEKLEYERLKK